MRIGILGTRGIPNNYGGFEQFAENLSLGLVKRGHSVSVYSSHSHHYKLDTFKEVQIIHKYDPEKRIGTIGQFIYDFNCIVDSRRKEYDIILQLGYTSSAIWAGLLPKQATVITNMDGLEWKRSKFSKQVRKFLMWSERKAVLTSDYLIADSLGIKKYIEDFYDKDAVYIPYGAEVFQDFDESILSKYSVVKGGFDLLIARMEPENNILMILEAFSKSESDRVLLVVGNYDLNRFGESCIVDLGNLKNIKFLGGLYDINALNNLRSFSNLYFHGHSVGGTNPSLLEAMACGTCIIAHNNVFNRSILEDRAYYFDTIEDLAPLIKSVRKSENEHFCKSNQNAISQNLAGIGSSTIMSYLWQIPLNKFGNFNY